MQLRDLYNFLHETWNDTIRLDDQAVDIVMMRYQEEIISMTLLPEESKDKVNWLQEGF